MTIYATLCYILKNDKTLLIKKSEELFGGGKLNAPGGKLKLDEDKENGIRREVLEETGLRIKNLKYHGFLKYFFRKGHEKSCEPDWVVYVFSTDSFEGKLKQSKEGILEWFDIKNIPYQYMWKDNRYWAPLVLEGKSFLGEFYFDEKGEIILHQNIKELIAWKKIKQNK